MPVELALYQPDIPQNTGTLMRLGACFGVVIHVIHPTGFAFSERSFRRAGMDYLDKGTLAEHASFAAFDQWRLEAGKRLVLLTDRARQSAYSAQYALNDILMVGRETAGVPESVAATADLAIRIPMRDGLRSINVALAATLVLGEAMRQTNSFETLV